METTPYFDEVVRRNHPEANRMDWIDTIDNAPLETQSEANGRIRYWGFINEAGRYMRVVLEPDGQAVHNAFFDRTYARRRRREGKE